MAPHKSEDFKLSAVKHYLKIKNQTETCRVFGCSERSLMRWVKKFKITKDVKRKTRKYIAYKVKKEYVKFIKKEIKKAKTITMSDLTSKLNKKFNVNLSSTHITSVVKDLNITLKQTKVRHEPKTRYKKPIDINKQIDEFYKTIKKYKLNDIISIDETSLNAYEVRKHCYETIGKRCVIKTHSQEVFKKYTGIFAISTKGVIGYEIYDKGGIDSVRLVNFLNKFIVKKYKNKLIILDNASSHRNKNVKDVIQKDNNLLYAVPYQHFTNVIEGYFSVLKSKLRKQNDVGLNKLKQNIRKLIKEIPKTTYKKLFQGSYNRTKKYKPKKTRAKTLKIYK
jgi:transposase